MWRMLWWGVGTAMIMTLSACAGLNHSFPLTHEIPPSDHRPSDEPLYLAKVSFDNGNYGMAERHFRRAIEENKTSADAWLGLAASYDRLKRFDLASRSYSNVVKLVGRTPAVLNNLGYHFLLQSKFDQARRHFLEAQEKDPDNILIANNLKLLDEWVKGPRDHLSERNG